MSRQPARFETPSWPALSRQPSGKAGRYRQVDLGIAGKKALVVGASEGIGFETARGLAEEGACNLLYVQ